MSTTETTTDLTPLEVTPFPPITGDVVEIAEKLGRKADVDTRDINSTGAFIAERVRNDETIQVSSLEKYLGAPQRPRGTVTVHDPSDFAQLVNRLADDHHTTVWANVDTGGVVAVFDDHADADSAGWRSHTALLSLKADPDWQLWLQQDSKLSSQEWFAEHLEALAHTVVEPDAATLLEIATSFRATKKADFSGGVRLDTGDVEFKYHEETNAKAGKSGKLEIPETFTIRIAPWRGVDPVDLTARLRYRLDDGQLRIGYALLRPDRAKDDAFALILQVMRMDVNENVPLFKGTAPAAITPTS